MVLSLLNPEIPGLHKRAGIAFPGGKVQCGQRGSDFMRSSWTIPSFPNPISRIRANRM